MCNYPTIFVSYKKKNYFLQQPTERTKTNTSTLHSHCTSIKPTKEVKNQLASSYPLQLLFTLHSTKTKIEAHYNKP